MSHKVIIDPEQLESLCDAIVAAAKIQAEPLDHVLGPCREPYSIAHGIHRVADALEAIASAIRDRE
jgi:hypothetical protein